MRPKLKKIRAQEAAVRHNLSNASWIIALIVLILAFIPIISNIVVLYFNAYPAIPTPLDNSFYIFFFEQANLITVIFTFVFFAAALIELILVSQLIKFKTKHIDLTIFQIFISAFFFLFCLVFVIFYLLQLIFIDPGVYNIYKDDICWVYERITGIIAVPYLLATMLCSIKAL